MRPHPTNALRRALQAQRARRWQRDMEDTILAAARNAAKTELGTAHRVPFRTLPVYRKTCAATGVRPGRTVLPNLPDVLDHLDALAAPLRADEPLVAHALLANAAAEREHRTAVAR